jgi:hypothetical protein
MILTKMFSEDLLKSGILALRSTQNLTEISRRNFPWMVKATCALGWQLTTFMCRLSEYPGSLKHLESLEPI